jgi:hypothetical protein
VISPLVRRACEQAGLLPALQARKERTPLPSGKWTPILEQADLLAVGALSDYVTRSECGETVRIHVPSPPRPSTSVIVLDDRESLGGTELLRKIAILRLLGPPALCIVFDWAALGWELAQIALAFGASELSGPVLCVERSATGRKAVDRARVIALVHRAKKTPVFVESEARDAAALASDTSDATRLTSDGMNATRLTSDGMNATRLTSDGMNPTRLTSDGMNASDEASTASCMENR